MKRIRSKFSDAELSFIKENCTMDRKEMVSLLNSTFNKEYKIVNISALCKRNGWLTGRTGRYEEGNTDNTNGFKLPIGTEILHDNGVKVKVGSGYRDWKLKSHIVWEQSNGKIPNNMQIRFFDGDKTNCTIENLYLVSNAEAMRVNVAKISEQPMEIRATIVLISKLEQKAYELIKE